MPYHPHSVPVTAPPSSSESTDRVALCTLLIGVACFIAGYYEFQPFHLFGLEIQRGLIGAIGVVLALHSLTYFTFFASSGSAGQSSPLGGHCGGTHAERPAVGLSGSDEQPYSAGNDYPSWSPLESAPDLDAQFSAFSSSRFDAQLSVYPSGFDEINPGSGLPTVGGAGSPDICGNAWGHGSNDF